MTQLVAVVTGAANGIGRAVVKSLVDRGWFVYALDRTEASFDDASVKAFACDVTNEDELQQVAAQVGPVHGLVPAAGINLRPDDASVRFLQRDAWDRTLDVNLTGTMLTVRSFFSNLVEGAAITTLGSTAALAGTPGADAYTATKGAVVALTRAWSSEFSRFQVRVNCVCPGVTDTAMMGNVSGVIEREKMLETPMQRMARPEEISEVIAFTLAPEVSYLSGAILPVDGGATAHLGGMPFPQVRPKTSPNLAPSSQDG